MYGSAARAPWLVWLGGAAFVASLGLFVYCYFVVFGPTAGSGHVLEPVALNTLLFSAFALHHSVLARTSVKRRLVKIVAPRLERSIYVWVASGLFALVCLSWQPVDGVLYARAGWRALPHWLAVVAGALLTWRAAAVLDPLELAGIRQAGGDARTAAFRVVGPYRWMRHPIYLGLMLIVFGVPEMTGTRLTFAIVSSAYLVIAIPFEERSLAAAFGETYREYQRRVRWRVLPGIW
jgi:protein-S-isoprenylcysteine O-methyltransferase Ste14